MYNEEDDLFNAKYLKDIEKYVYHYTTIEKALEYILDSGKIRVSPFCMVNDPMEYNRKIVGLIWEENKYSGKNPLNIATQVFKDYITNYTKVLCMVSDDPILSCIEPVYKELHRGYARARMWAQYSNNHRGICLVFDKNALDETIKQTYKDYQVYSGRVKYEHTVYLENDPYFLNLSLHHVSDIETYLKSEQIPKNKDEYFFRKILDWKDEQEYRWVIISNNTDYELIDIKPSLKGIIVGDKFPEIYNYCLKYLNNKYKVNLGKIYWNINSAKVKELKL